MSTRRRRINGTTAGGALLPVPRLVLSYPAAYLPLLLHHQYKCRRSGKGRITLTLLTLQESWGPSGLTLNMAVLEGSHSISLLKEGLSSFF